MLSAVPSPTIHSRGHNSPLTTYGRFSHYENAQRPSSAASPTDLNPYRDPRASNPSVSVSSIRSPTAQTVPQTDKQKHQDQSARQNCELQTIRRMVDASTQYSPPAEPQIPSVGKQTPISRVASLHLRDERDASSGISKAASSKQRMDLVEKPQEQASVKSLPPFMTEASSARTKRPAHEQSDDASIGNSSSSSTLATESAPVNSKRPRPDASPVRFMPVQYETCDPRDLVILISSMLMELIRYNDAIPLRDGQLTRFHSRAPPGISVLDYLQRLTVHATLPPPILLSMVYYIDRLCALYPAFTISSLTVHRFLITSATVASKGLSDSFWTNKIYARVGGVSMKELALLELEFLGRVEWRIVPRPEVLVDYYRSLIERSDGYELEGKAQ